MDGFSVVERFPMHWGEMDALGHANNTRYFAWFETARIAYFARVALEAGRPTSVGPILASTSCDFIKPIVYPASLVVGARVIKLGTKSFTMEYQVALSPDENTPYARGIGVVVMFDYAAARTVEIPEAIRATIKSIDGIL